MKERIQSELRRIEEQHDIRVLLAVESGSRAWGFASPDSDYDVRFIYANRRDWYLSVFERRDVIEEMLEGDLDISGWDLRKTLRLFSKCNLALNEWLGSPIVYSSVTEFHTQLAALMSAHFNPIAGLHHYRRTAERMLTDNIQEDRIPIKKLFYVLRPLLACRWISRAQSQPPTEFDRLVAQSWVTEPEREWIESLLARKAGAIEAEPVRLTADQLEALQSEIRQYQAAERLVDAPSKARGFGDLDELLRRWVV